MNKEIAKKWVEALRSGKYKQGTGRLCTLDAHGIKPEGFCCLGVLCELAVEAGVVNGVAQTMPRTLLPADDTQRDNKVHYYRYVDGTGDGHHLYLPVCVREWAEITSNMVLFSDTCEISLPRMNDTDKLSFAEIADVIEQHAEDL